jgi:hypothetical protein
VKVTRQRLIAELDRHYGGWIDNGKLDKCRCPCGYHPMLGESHSAHVADEVLALLR